MSGGEETHEQFLDRIGREAAAEIAAEEARDEETVGERLHRLRRRAKLSQRALSEPGVSYAYISRIEAGTRQPSVKALRKLAPKLGVTVAYLETGVEERVRCPWCRAEFPVELNRA